MTNVPSAMHGSIIRSFVIGISSFGFAIRHSDFFGVT